MNSVFTNEEIVFFGVCGFSQKWTDKRSFSYLDSPRPNHGIIYILCGEALFEEKSGRKKAFLPGDIVYLPKNAKYKVSFRGEEAEIRSLLVNFMTENEMAFSDEITWLANDSDSRLESHFSNIISSYRSKRNALFPIMSSFFLLLNELFPTPNAVSLPADTAILPALDYIDTHIGENPSVEKLARLCLISESGFRKRFSRAIGTTPHDYILKIKLERAARMLKSAEIPVAQIAEELGFCDSAHFTRAFSARYKKSPFKYRTEMEKY